MLDRGAEPKKGRKRSGAPFLAGFVNQGMTGEGGGQREGTEQSFTSNREEEKTLKKRIRGHIYWGNGDG